MHRAPCIGRAFRSIRPAADAASHGYVERGPAGSTGKVIFFSFFRGQSARRAEGRPTRLDYFVDRSDRRLSPDESKRPLCGHPFAATRVGTPAVLKNQHPLLLNF